MSRVLLQLVLLVVSAVLSWWALLAAPSTAQPSRSASPPPGRSTVALRPELAAHEPAAVPAPRPAEPQAAVPPEQIDHRAETQETAPPPPELGSPEGEAEAEAASETPSSKEGVKPEPAALQESIRAAAQALREAEQQREATLLMMKSAELLEAAEAELSGSARKGFATELAAAPEDQLDIARFFGEELVLVPRRALDPDSTAPLWFRLAVDETSVETVRSPPPLERYRQYRDLFAYEYARLPEPLRELRRSVLARGEVYLFAALIPPAEWALVVGRRRAALAEAGRREDEVRRFALRYVRRSPIDFDVEVVEIQFADGTRFRPESPVSGG